MAPALLGLLPSLLPMLGEVLDRVIPDKAEAAKARLEMESKLLEAATLQATQQTDINKIEAAHSSLFVSGWRPFIGWVCGAGAAGLETTILKGTTFLVDTVSTPCV